jgi:hypothetical protein
MMKGDGTGDLIGSRRRCVEGIERTSLSAVLSATVGAQGVVTGITPGGDAMTMILGTTTVMSVAGEIDEEAVRTPGSSCAIKAELALVELMEPSRIAAGEPVPGPVSSQDGQHRFGGKRRLPGRRALVRRGTTRGCSCAVNLSEG